MTIQTVQFGTCINRETAERKVELLRLTMTSHYLSNRIGFDVGAAPVGGCFAIFLQADVDEDDNLAEIVADQLLLRLAKVTP